jgi:DNA-directed RNA polymerase subunit RPC12/RpoP
MKEITVEVRYKAGHSYIHKYKKDNDLFCPKCGQKGVWIEQGDGDYYLGENYICTSCEHEFTIQGPYEVKEPHDQIVTSIKGASK